MEKPGRLRSLRRRPGTQWLAMHQWAAKGGRPKMAEGEIERLIACVEIRHFSLMAWRRFAARPSSQNIGDMQCRGPLQRETSDRARFVAGGHLLSRLRADVIVGDAHAAAMKNRRNFHSARGRHLADIARGRRRKQRSRRAPPK